MMFRALAFFVAFAITLAADMTTVSAAPPSYDIFCVGFLSADHTLPAGTAYAAYDFAVQAAPDFNHQYGTCGWFTRAWRAGEPQRLCISPVIAASLRQNGYQVYGDVLTVPGLRSFSVYNDFKGCMVVTGFRADETAGFPSTKLLCRDVFKMSAARMVGFLNAFPFTVFRPSPGSRSQPPGSCFASDATALPPSGLLCADSSPADYPTEAYPQGTFSTIVSPWWPCGIAHRDPSEALPPPPPPAPAPSPSATP